MVLTQPGVQVQSQPVPSFERSSVAGSALSFPWPQCTRQELLDGMRCAGPPQGAMVFTIVFLHNLPQGLLQTYTTTAKSISSFWEVGCSPPEYTGRKLLCMQCEWSGGMSPGAKFRVNHAAECRVWSSSGRWNKANRVCPKLQGLILSCCKSAWFGITKAADLATWLYLCSVQQMIKYKCVLRWCGQYVRMTQECV